MTDAWSTIVTREPEYDDYTVSRIMALEAWEARRCPTCGNYDALVPFESETRHVRWAEHNGRKVEVVQYRCIFCGAADLIRRDWFATHENDKPTPGNAAPADGRMFVARPPSKED